MWQQIAQAGVGAGLGILENRNKKKELGRRETLNNLYSALDAKYSGMGLADSNLKAPSLEEAPLQPTVMSAGIQGAQAGLQNKAAFDAADEANKKKEGQAGGINQYMDMLKMGSSAMGSGGGGGGMASSMGSMGSAMSDARVKTNIEECDPSQFLDALTAFSYDYKNPAHGEGKQIGIMAQDLEKVAPQAVIEMPDGMKMVDFNKLGGPIMATLAALHKRVKELESKLA